jgi:2-oxo-4-hydroxy-4-carboxy-5-ureidoimidazoline decarboxylase
MSIEELNNLSFDQARAELIKCCGSVNWVNQMFERRPFSDLNSVLEGANDAWGKCNENDWLEAFGHHPKIGDIESLKKKFIKTSQWARGEQKGVETAKRSTLERLAELNTIYVDKFGFIFIVCATGKSAEEMLEMLEIRIRNSHSDELKIAMKEQNKISILRLKKLLS